MQNHGLIELKKPPLLDWIFGGATKLPKIILEESRDYTPYLPAIEYQKNYDKDFDVMGCVAFSALNCNETVVKRKYGLDVDFSDRFTVVMSETDPDRGNYLHRVAESIRVDGLIPEKIFPFNASSKSEYYSKPSQEFVELGKSYLTVWKPGYEWIDWAGCDPEVLWEALQYAPLQVTLHAWGQPVDEVYNYINKQTNHAVMLFKGQYRKYWWIYDHYYKAIKKLSWDFYFGSCMRHNIDRIMMKLIKSDDSPEVFALDPQGKKHHIPNMKQLRRWNEMKVVDSEEDIEVISQSKLDLIEEAEPMLLGII